MLVVLYAIHFVEQMADQKVDNNYTFVTKGNNRKRSALSAGITYEYI